MAEFFRGGEREIMLFIGKPRGISNMISNGGRLSNEWQ